MVNIKMRNGLDGHLFHTGKKQQLQPKTQNTLTALICLRKVPVSKICVCLDSVSLAVAPQLEMRCYRKILRISYEHRVTNEEVRAKIQQAIRPHEDLLTIVQKQSCSGMVMPDVHQVWLKPSCKAQ